MTDAKDEIHPCNCCGLPTHLDDLDAKDDGTGDYTILECGDCYGPGYYTLHGERVMSGKTKAARENWTPPREKETFDLIWNYTHSDHRTTVGGVRCVLIGGNLVPIQSLTAKELRDRYAIAKRLQTRGKQPY